MDLEPRQRVRHICRAVLVLAATAAALACALNPFVMDDDIETDADSERARGAAMTMYAETGYALQALEHDIRNTQTAWARPSPVSAVPVIHGIEFPRSIPADGTVHMGLVSFSDDDGDVTRMQMIVISTSTDFQGADVTPVLMSGTRYKGAYRFRVWCYQPDTISVLVLLNDAQQNQSLGAPLTFTCK